MIAGRQARSAVAIASLMLSACDRAATPTRPESVAAAPTAVIALEAERGEGDGLVVERSRASGGMTVHLGPGERREWRFKIAPEEARYAVSVTYANGKEGDNEDIAVGIDGVRIAAFRNRDSGDAIEGWNQFVTDDAGTAMFRAGAHLLVLDVAGGDGCVEIDFVTLRLVR